METRTIPADQWIPFFDQFSRDHVGWATTIQVLDRSIGAAEVARELPLQGLSFDTKGSRTNTIEVSAGETDTYVRHVVDLPLRIRVAEENDGSIDLQIEAADGPQTLIHLHERAQ